MSKLRSVALATLLAGVVTLTAAAEPSRVVGCVKTAKACTCYRPSGRPAEVAADLCEAKFQPLAVMTFAGGDIAPLLTVPKPVRAQEPEPEPYRHLPVPWLINR